MRNKQQKSRTKLCKSGRSSSTKKIIIFDLDGTLTKSKTVLDKEMASLLCRLLKKRIVAVLGGGNYTQFKNQFLDSLKCAKVQFKNLFILPVSGGSLYGFQNGKWRMIYKHTLTAKEKTKVQAAFRKAFRDINYIPPKKIYGGVIENRGSQITFSALGQKAPLNKKKEWNTKTDIRPQLRTALKKYLPNFEIRLGGLTSIDVTKKGINKAYGITEIMKLLSVSRKDVVYIGDALYEGGNDYIVKRAKIATVMVKNQEETKDFIRCFLSEQK
jgi:HAD superfamily hydrolase (TIGR01484 family)